METLKNDQGIYKVKIIDSAFERWIGYNSGYIDRIYLGKNKKDIFLITRRGLSFHLFLHEDSLFCKIEDFSDHNFTEFYQNLRNNPDYDEYRRFIYLSLSIIYKLVFYDGYPTIMIEKVHDDNEYLYILEDSVCFNKKTKEFQVFDSNFITKGENIDYISDIPIYFKQVSDSSISMIGLSKDESLIKMFYYYITGSYNPDTISPYSESGKIVSVFLNRYGFLTKGEDKRKVLIPDVISMNEEYYESLNLYPFKDIESIAIRFSEHPIQEDNIVAISIYRVYSTNNGSKIYFVSEGIQKIL